MYETESYIPPDIQSPLGILALISIVPTVKLKDFSVVIWADATGLMMLLSLPRLWNEIHKAY